MGFQAPITIYRALNHIREAKYVLPGIQREFVWSANQITSLFDSLMSDYPIGSFLFWNVDEDHCRDYTFYRFLNDYHQKDNRHNELINLDGKESIIAILDGQQRLTSLYVGLLGSYTYKIPRLWWNNPKAFPKRRLYLNLLSPVSKEEDVGLKYDFRFLTKDVKKKDVKKGVYWFPVKKIMKFKDIMDIIDYLRDHDLLACKDLPDPKYPLECLSKLHEMIYTKLLINYYQIEDQDLDKVLNIFIRVNSGGTQLSYSDLLLSIATSQWTSINARQAIHELVDELNQTGSGFNLNKDFVLKSCLVLADISNIGFRVNNFTRKNSQKIEANWSQISDSLRAAVQLVSRFGYERRTLRANNVLIPIAYYLHTRQITADDIVSNRYAEDRKAVFNWMTRALLKAGTFGSGLDTTLRTARSTIKTNSSSSFPKGELDKEFARIGKPLRFEEEEIEDLLDQSYGSPTAFSVLTLLYPGVDLANNFHIDHIYPRSRFTHKRLEKYGVPDDEISAFLERRDRIANLQLLEGIQNLEKSAKMPSQWLRERFVDQDELDGWKRRNYTDEVPEEMRGFLDFYESRREKMKIRLAQILEVSLADDSRAEGGSG